jgi:hypothetical protein
MIEPVNGGDGSGRTRLSGNSNAFGAPGVPVITCAEAGARVHPSAQPEIIITRAIFDMSDKSSSLSRNGNEVRRSFLKKRTKKLLSVSDSTEFAGLNSVPMAMDESFLLLFFKKEDSCFLPDRADYRLPVHEAPAERTPPDARE